MMTTEEERLLWRFCDWLRSEGLAICVRVDEPDGQRILWQPLSRSGRLLVQDFARDSQEMEDGDDSSQ